MVVTLLHISWLEIILMDNFCYFCYQGVSRRVRNTVTEYGCGKEFAGLSTGTDYFQKTKSEKIRVRTVFEIQVPETVPIRNFF